MVWIFDQDLDLEHTPAWAVGTAFLGSMTLATVVGNIVRKRLLRSAGEQYKQQLTLGTVPDANGRRALMQTLFVILGIVMASLIFGLVSGQRASSNPPSSADSSSLIEPVAPLNPDATIPASAHGALTVSTTRASSIPPAPQNVPVYFVPIGNLAVVDVPYLVGYYQQRFGLTITPLTAIAPGRTFDPRRRQFQAEALIRSIEAGYPDIANDGRSIMIGITEADIYTASENWRFALGLRAQGRLAVVSTARMDLDHVNHGTPVDSVALHSRLTKMISRELGFLYYRLPISRNQKSVMRSSIMGVDELDDLGEDF
jgi:predicted Zn-dependent protease